jgi:hypothetical protein
MTKKLLAFALAAALGMGSAAASNIALQWSGSGTLGGSEQTRGWAFSTDRAINITSLGWFDYEDNGLINSHEVGIWDASGNLQLSGIVGAGDSDPLLAGFRYSGTLTGSTLLAAGTYVVAGLSTYDDDAWREVDFARVTMGSGITYLEDRTSESTVFEFAGVTQGLDVGYFGANFQYDEVAAEVPEPSVASLSLLGLGMMGVAARKRRRGKNA